MRFHFVCDLLDLEYDLYIMCVIHGTNQTGSRMYFSLSIDHKIRSIGRGVTSAPNNAIA